MEEQELIDSCEQIFKNEYKYFLGDGDGEGVTLESLYVDSFGSITPFTANVKKEQEQGFSGDPDSSPSDIDNDSPNQNFILSERLISQIDNTSSTIHSYVVLGSSGLGKTSLALHLAKLCWKRFHDQTSSIIPLYIFLPRVVARLDKILEEYFTKWDKFVSPANVPAFCAALKKRKLLLILDSYDEISNKENLWNLNGWGEIDYDHDVKIVTFSRPEVFSSTAAITAQFDGVPRKGNLSRAKMGISSGSGSTAKPEQCTFYEKYYIQEFNPEQVQLYVNKFVTFITGKSTSKRFPEESYWASIQNCLTELSWKNPEEEYTSWLNRIQDLKELASTPYLLYLILQTLPLMVRKLQQQQQNQDSETEELTPTKLMCSTKAGIYDEFIYQWLSYQVRRNQSKFRLPPSPSTSALGSVSFNHLLGYYLAYSQNLATKLVDRHLGLLSDKLLSVTDTEEWYLAEPAQNQELLELYKTNELHKNLFPSSSSGNNSGSAEDEEIQRKLFNLRLLRNGCLIRLHGDQFRFFHRSLVEYLVARDIFETLQGEYDVFVREVLPPSSISHNYSGLDSEPIRERGILSQLVDRVKSCPSFLELLGEIILKSAELKLLSRLASNAITVLNLAGISFSGQDFRNIQVEGANLTGCILGNTDLRGANLRKTNLTNSHLCGTRLEGANLRDVELGNKPQINLTANLCDILSFDGRVGDVGNDDESYLWIASVDGSITKWSTNSVAKICTIKHNLKVCVKGAACTPITHGILILSRFSSDKFISYTKCSGKIKVWELGSGRKHTSFKPNKFFQPINHWELSVTCDSNRDSLIIFSGRKIQWVTQLASYSSSSASSASASSRTTTPPGVTDYEFKDQKLYILNCIFHPKFSTRCLVFFNLGICSLYELPNFELELWKIEMESSVAENLMPIFHQTGDYFAFANFLTYCCNIETGSVQSVDVEVDGIVLSSDGRLLASSGLGTINIWTFPQLDQFQKVMKCDHDMFVMISDHKLAFTLQDSWLAYGSINSNIVQLLQISEGISFGSDQLGQDTQADNVSLLAISPTGKTLAMNYGSTDTLIIFPVTYEFEAAIKCSTGTGEILAMEWLDNRSILIVGVVAIALVKIENLSTPKIIVTQPDLYKEQERISEAAIQSGKQLIAFCGFYSGTIILCKYELMGETLKEPLLPFMEIQGPPNDVCVDPIFQVQFDPTGKFLITRTRAALTFYKLTSDSSSNNKVDSKTEISEKLLNYDYTFIISNRFRELLNHGYTFISTNKFLTSSRKELQIRRINPDPQLEIETEARFSLDLGESNVMGYEAKGQQKLLACGNMTGKLSIYEASPNFDKFTPKMWLDLWYWILNIKFVVDEHEGAYFQLIVTGVAGNASCIRIDRTNFQWTMLWTHKRCARLRANDCQIAQSLINSNEAVTLLHQNGAKGQQLLTPAYAYVPFCTVIQEVPGTASCSQAVRPIISTGAYKSFLISSEAWVISAAIKNLNAFRLVNTSHAFLIVEGIINNRRFAIRAELEGIRNTNQACIVLKPLDDFTQFENSAKSYKAQQWNISKSDGLALLENIQLDQQRNIKYTYLRNNCVKWCLDQLALIKIRPKKTWYSNLNVVVTASQLVN